MLYCRNIMYERVVLYYDYDYNNYYYHIFYAYRNHDCNIDLWMCICILILHDTVPISSRCLGANLHAVTAGWWRGLRGNEGWNNSEFSGWYQHKCWWFERHDFEKFTNQTTAHILHMNTCTAYSYIHIMIHSIYAHLSLSVYACWYT